MQPSFIELPTPSSGSRHIWRYFDRPDNPDNIGFIRCKTCYVRFPPSFSEHEMLEHMKSHEGIWSKFFDSLESKLNSKYNRESIKDNDERKKMTLNFQMDFCLKTNP